MSVNVPLCLQLVCTNASQVQAPSGITNTWYTATFEIPNGNYQYYNAPDLSQYYYSTLDIKKGYWIAGYQGGHAWRIVDVFTEGSDMKITLTLEDVDNYNMQIDGIANYGALSAFSNYICFQVNNDGLPVFAPLYAKYIDSVLPQLPSDILSRFLYRNPTKQYVQVEQSDHTFQVGDPVWLNPASGAYELANTGATAKYIIGIVSSVGVPTADYFTYKSFGAYYADIQSFFSSTDAGGSYTEFSLTSLFPMITPGKFVYIDTDTNTPAKYTITPPTDMAIPVWVYLGVDPLTNREMAILYTTPSLYNQTGGSGGSGTGATGPEGPQGPQGAPGQGFKIFATTSVQSTAGTTENVGEFLLDTTVSGQSKLYLYNGNNNGTTGFGSAYTYVSDLASTINVVGEKGPTGERGQDGAVGTQGATGAQGPTGPSDGAMPWIQTNIIDSPPAATIGTIIPTSTDIYIPWTYPEQIYLNLINSWAPVINTFNAELYYKTNPAAPSLTQRSIVTDGTGASYVNDHSTNSYITGIILTKVSTASSGVITATFPGESTPRKAYRYYHADLASMVSGTPKLVVWYNKYTPKKVEVTLPLFLTPGPPSAPLITDVSAASSSSLTVQYNAPTTVDTGDANSTATITGYTITYSSSGSTERYGGPIADSVKSVNTPNRVYTLTNLVPDSPYTVKVKATNSSGYTSSDYTYGSTVDPSPLTPSANLTSISPVSSTPVYTGTLLKVSDGAPISQNLIRVNASTPSVQFNPISIPIHTVSTRGSTNAGLAALDVSVLRGSTTVSQETVSFGGFGVADPTDSNLVPITIASSTADTYAASAPSYQGFHKTGTSTITLNSTGLFDATTSAPIKLSVTQQQKPTTSSAIANVGSPVEYQFYYDTLSASPTIQSVTLTRVTSVMPTTQKLSGLTVIRNNITYDITTTVTNMGKHFYKTPLLEYTNTNTTNTISITEPTTNNITSGITNGAFDNQLIFVRRHTITPLSASYSVGLDVTVKANNLFGASSAITTAPSKIIIDEASMNYINHGTLYPRSIPPITMSSGFVRGAHITSGVAQSSVSSNPYVPALTYTGQIYDHSESLINNQELQIYNGSFRTSASGYLNYSDFIDNTGLDYSTLPTVNGYRFATFKWDITESGGQINTVSFLLDGITNGSLQFNNITYNTIFTGTTTPLLFYYRFVGKNSSNGVPTDTNDVTSVWINGSSQAGTSVNTANYNSPTDNTVSYSGLNTYSSTTTSYTLNTLYPFRGIQPSFLYCRIGIPTNLNFKFDHISAKLNN